MDYISTCRVLSPPDECVFYLYGEARKFKVSYIVENHDNPLVLLKDPTSNAQLIRPLDEVLEYNFNQEVKGPNPIMLIN